MKIADLELIEVDADEQSRRPAALVLGLSLAEQRRTRSTSTRSALKVSIDKRPRAKDMNDQRRWTFSTVEVRPVAVAVRDRLDTKIGGKRSTEAADLEAPVRSRCYSRDQPDQGALTGRSLQGAEQDDEKAGKARPPIAAGACARASEGLPQADVDAERRVALAAVRAGGRHRPVPGRSRCSSGGRRRRRRARGGQRNVLGR